MPVDNLIRHRIISKLIYAMNSVIESSCDISCTIFKLRQFIKRGDVQESSLKIAPAVAALKLNLLIKNKYW